MVGTLVEPEPVTTGFDTTSVVLAVVTLMVISSECAGATWLTDGLALGLVVFVFRRWRSRPKAA